MSGRGLKCAPEGEPPPRLAAEEPLSGVKLVDAPVLLLVYFHKALQAELAELRRVAEEAAERGSGGRELIGDLRRRLEFLKVVYKYHCTTEDEVIFMALDFRIKNVVCTYTLEHESIDDLFHSISDCLSVIMDKEENTAKQFQELVFCIGTIQAVICQHMLKEEKQVFPLLMQQFSIEEQASLIWQFLCSVPIMLLEDFLPWLTSFLSPDEQEDILHCIIEVVPKEKLLQEVVISWLHNNNPSSFSDCNEIGKGAEIPDLLASSKDILKLCASKSFYGEKWWSKNASHKTSVKRTAIDGLHLWHDAIRKDFKGILKDLYQIRSSQQFSTLGSVIVQLKFFADVLIFYSTALEKNFNPVLSELANGYQFHFLERFQYESQIEGLLRLLYHKDKNGIPLCNFVEKLCGELELFVMGISGHLALLETEVLPFISKNCTHEFQQWLLYTSLRIVPLGLLKYMITWFSAHLSEDDCNSIMNSLKPEGPLDNNNTFALLLCKWIHTGYSGKTSIDKFRNDLQEMFKSRSYFLTEHVKEDYTFVPLLLNIRPCNSSNPGASQPHSVIKAKGSAADFSFSDSGTTLKYGKSYSSRTNLHIFSSQILEILSPLPKFPAESSGASSIFNLEPRPVDHIFFFHKALKKDLEYLVVVSAKLGENVGDLMNFCRRFQLVRFLYQIHSDSEDEIAFPALEAKGKALNISQSYSIDHKLEVQLFNKISIILDEISGLHVSVSTIDVGVLDQRMLNYRQLCLKLHDMCKSMHKVLCDHVHREEVELWPLFRECLSIEEQEKIVGCMLGRTRAEILQEMIPWLMASLTPEEQLAMMSLWRKATKNTMFDEWLKEWWEGMKRYDIAKAKEESNISTPWTSDPLKVLSTYLSNKGFDDQDRSQKLDEEGAKFVENNSAGSDIDPSGNLNVDGKGKVFGGKVNNHQCADFSEISCEVEKKRCEESAEVRNQADKPSQHVQITQEIRHQEHLPIMSQEEMEATIRRISRDSTLDPQKKAYVMQNLLMSRWIITQQKTHSEVPVSSNKEEVPGQSPSYKDPVKLTFGCKHYKRNCKLVAACCNQLYACRLCHDDVADHSMDRKATTKMMCMKCLMIQPLGATCSTLSCNNLSMAKYYCRICKLFDDDRDIYHCPFCNLCRVGKGLGIDYFHCMNCNACMSRSLSVHICIEKCFENNCPICHEYIFTSCSPVKALPCGHLMHSACFQDYTCTHYTCPICSKSLGDMQVYFGMLDALLAEEKIPDEYSGKTQVILCNDCEKRGTASFHWLYHKCSHCGSYNTRPL
ncbi:Zinc finger protein BRUTUS-like [Actinidia chinensis var. chinensis]|uniref:Zinc finger protein BRUTUS-like n=1 Tax=Actinidia chinensis var. chinensis TaxID=1590841 RepID=A0A2R6PE46_ACTCC|nr:Zinc finger protein BRUTUS-like [Actinidia chinensis var. chinensis]